jgi:excinuclease Cho
MRPRVTSVGLYLRPDPRTHFIPPTHIDRDSLDALPRTSGVYLFRNRHDTPVYIGKSVNIRARVLSHLRTADEAEMLHATTRVDFIRTAGEIGALLLESQMIKEMQPAYNRLLRHIGPTYALHLPEDAPAPIVIGSHEYSKDDCYGLYASRAAAQDGIRALLKRFRLCPVLCGLEKAIHGRACFSHQIGHCLGACIGKESPDAHRQRMRDALQELESAVWPYAGAIGIVEECDGWRQTHVIERWSYLGSLEGRRKKIKRPASTYVDIDTYKILIKPLLTGSLAVIPLS